MVWKTVEWSVKYMSSLKSLYSSNIRVGTSKNKNIDHRGKEICALFRLPIRNKYTAINTFINFVWLFRIKRKRKIRKLNSKQINSKKKSVLSFSFSENYGLSGPYNKKLSCLHLSEITIHIFISHFHYKFLYTFYIVTKQAGCHEYV